MIMSKIKLKEFIGNNTMEEHRVQQIMGNATKAKDLFDSFNETKMDDFMKHKENLILMEYFLQNQKQFFMMLQKPQNGKKREHKEKPKIMFD